jgi:hypothetical protein
MDLITRRPRREAPVTRWAATVAFVAGGALLVWSGYIHYHLWKSVGYRQIPTIGDLFLLQSAAGLVLGLLAAAVHRVWTAILGLGFAASTIAGFYLSVDLTSGLFGFKDSASAPFAHLALTVEIGAIVVLLIAGALCLIGSAPSTRTGTTPPAVPSTGV